MSSFVPSDKMAKLIGDATAHAVRSLMADGQQVQQKQRKGNGSRKQRRSPPRSSPTKEPRQGGSHTDDVLPRFDLKQVDHSNSEALGKAEHKMGNPCYLCKKFGHLSGVHFPTNHRWCQADSDRWTSNRDYWHKILRDVREKRYTRYQIAENLEVDTSRWPRMSDREFLAAVMEAATGLPRWDDGTDPKTTPPQPVKDAPTAEFFQHSLLPASAPPVNDSNVLALPAPPGTAGQAQGFAFQPRDVSSSKGKGKKKLKPKRGKRDRAGDPATDLVATALNGPNNSFQIALNPSTSTPSLSLAKTPPSSRMQPAIVGLPAHALNARVQDAEESLKTLTEDRKHIWQQLGRIDQSVTDLKRSTSVSQSLMGTLLVKVGGVSPDEMNALMQQAKEAALAELPPSLDPQIEEKMRLATLEDTKSGPAAPTAESLLTMGADMPLHSGRISISNSSDDNRVSAFSEDLTMMDHSDAPTATENQGATPKANELREWQLGWRPAQEWKMVDMAALLQCRGSLLTPPAIKRRNEGVHALSHTGQGLHMVVLAPGPAAVSDGPPERTHQVVTVRSVGLRPAGHLVLGPSSAVTIQNPLEPALESAEACPFDTWEMNTFDKVFFWEEAAHVAADELNAGKPLKRPCLTDGTASTSGTAAP